MKWMFALQRGSGTDRACDGAGRRVLYASDPDDGLMASQLGREPRPHKADGVLSCWWDDEGEKRLPDAHAYQVDEVLHWDYERDWPDGELSPGVVAFYFVRRRPDLSQEEFRKRYAEGHAPLARVQHPGIWRYAQNYVTARSEGAPEWHAISQLHFRSEEDFRTRFYRDAESPKIVAEDIARFADVTAALALITRERIYGA